MTNSPEHFWQGRRILISGAGGFIGGHLVQQLEKLGANNIYCLQRTDSKSVLSKNTTSLRCDRSFRSIERAVANAQPEFVFHLASFFLSSHDPFQVDDLVWSNVLFGSQLAEAASKFPNCVFINIGSIWQHFNSSDYAPVNLYAATKQAFEDILAFYEDSKLLKTVSLLLSDTYGANDPRRKLMSLLLTCAANGEKLEMSPGHQMIDLVHVTDVAQALIHTAQARACDQLPHSRYRVSGLQELTLRELATLVERVTQKQLSIEWGAREYRPREMMKIHCSAPMLSNLRPSVDLSMGISELWRNEYLRSSLS